MFKRFQNHRETPGNAFLAYMELVKTTGLSQTKVELIHGAGRFEIYEYGQER